MRVQQGDPFGPFLFALTLHPLLHKIKENCKLLFDAWYPDDGTVIKDSKEVDKVLDIIKVNVPGLAMIRARNVVDLVSLILQLDDPHSELLLLRSCMGIAKLFFGLRTCQPVHMEEATLFLTKLCWDLHQERSPCELLTNPSDGRSTLKSANVLVFKWVEGKHACVDLTGVSPLVRLSGRGFTAGQDSLKVASCKVTKHKKSCIENQHVFIPFVFDTFGFLALEAVKLLSRVQRVMHSNVMTPRSTDVVFKRIGFAIQKGLAAQLIARLPSNIMYIPETRSILDQFHHGPTSGHYGPTTTAKKVLDSGFYWSNYNDTSQTKQNFQSSSTTLITIQDLCLRQELLEFMSVQDNNASKSSKPSWENMYFDDTRSTSNEK
nr:putative reverse transcriptase domain-containing protein [Tanacetum cinerariifolium]